MFLLLMAILMAFHLSFAVHYCSGRIASVNMYGNATGMCCCGNEVNECADRPHHISAITFGYLPDSDASCCSDKILAIATDDYRTPSAVTVFKSNMVITPFIFVQTHVLQLDKILATLDCQIIFPPGSFSASGIDLLTQICIFRI
ncbi:MAG: hypothetical protein LBL33_10605 [Tannerella sp.]|nr:hypothetical protein [Tannerella sp.]